MRKKVLFLFVLVALVSYAGTPAEKQWWHEKKASQQSELIWKVTDQKGASLECKTRQIDNRTVLLTETNHAAITGAIRYEPNMELSIRFRLVPPSGVSAGLTALAAVNPNGDTNKQTACKVTISAQGGIDKVNWGFTGISTNGLKSGTHNLRGIPERSLSWPEDLRKLIEHDMASLPSLSEKWMSVRYTFRKDCLRAYLNDKLIAEEPEQRLTESGLLHLQLDLSPNLELESIRAQSLPDSDIFVPVYIDGSLNTSQMDGKAAQRDSLPRPGSVSFVKDVPFIFPELDEKNNDHIDIGRSWLHSGYLEVANWPEERWKDAFNENPSRLRFRVPKGRYKALHIIGAIDHEPDSVPIISIQFYRPNAGHPINFTRRIADPTGKESDTTSLPVKLMNGKEANMYLITVPIEPGEMAWFDDLGILEMELTKEVKLFRSYPDPMHYSFHGAGLPSSVHVYAMTLERPAVRLALEANAYAHIWTAPATPSYTVKLANQTLTPQKVKLEMAMKSYDGTKTANQEVSLTVPAGGNETSHNFTLKPEQNGYHTVTLTMKYDDSEWVEKRTLAYLHADTREKDGWQRGHGPYFGHWKWSAPSVDKEAYVMGLAGMKYPSFQRGNIWWMLDLISNPTEEEAAKLIEKIKNEKKEVTDPEFCPFFPEPSIGDHTHGCLPSYWGEPEYKFSESEEATYKKYEQAFILGARAVKKEWPNIKCLLPWGDPLFCVPFLRRSKEVRDLTDGVAVDIACFERLPEQQLHQISLHRLYMCREELRQAGISNPWLPMYEGPCISSKPGAVSEKEQADLYTRYALILLAYGIEIQTGTTVMFECASAWGENHYGGGALHRIPLAMPMPGYAAMATLTRQLNGRNFSKWLPTGSLSTYALEFKHYKTGESAHVFWTIRGKRPVTLNVPEGAKITVFDQMDNSTTLPVKEGKVQFTVDQTPCFVYGLGQDTTVTLGESDHSDAFPAPVSARVGNPGDGTWKLSREEDNAYTSNNYFQIRRYVGEMSMQPVNAPEEKGSKALAIHLGAQKTERKVMPFYVTLVPERGIPIPGKGSHIGIWVKAASDWGRVVYSLRDAKGERWMSIGTKDSWNCDDIHNWSFFCFDGWRYLRFELPAHSPYDLYREKGSPWWGHFGEGDGIEDLPLTIEKIIVERRTHAMYVNDPQPAKPDDVLLADIYVEYEKAEDHTDTAIKLSKIHMPIPQGIPELENPIQEMGKTGIGDPAVIKEVTPPDQYYDGTRCHVHFEPVKDAKSYDIWVSPYADGCGALKLGKDWKESGQLLTGLRPDTDFYVFVVYTDKDGKLSKPSKPLKIRLKDLFGNK